MEEETNKALIRRWFDEVWNKGRAEAIYELIAPDCKVHGLGVAVLRGPEEFEPFHASFVGALSDMHISVDDVLAEGDMTAARLTVTGTHTGDHLGLDATGKRVSFTGMTFTRWRDGQIVEGWNNVDLPGLMKQIEAG